jgi:xanthine dehydrogenase YagT iron-sulfur-binding subunit
LTLRNSLVETDCEKSSNRPVDPFISKVKLQFRAQNATVVELPIRGALVNPSNEMQDCSFRVNGVEKSLTIEPRVSLLDALRDHLGLHGTKKGCDQGACGACTVLVDGERINSCLALAIQYEGREIVTIEGLAKGGQLHPLQQAFIDHDGFQCGYCTPGQICSAVGMLSEFRNQMPSAVTNGEAAELTDTELRERMSGNLCRCGAYVGIREAILQVFSQKLERPRDE